MENENDFRQKYESRVLPFYRGGRFGEFSGAGGLKVRFVAFEKKGNSGSLIILPGKSETYLKYAEFLYDLWDLPLNLYAMDHRGMGYSERPLPDRLKMHVERFEYYIEDVRTFVDSVIASTKQDRLFVFGHSTGALIAALYMEYNPATFKAGVLCSPFFDAATGPIPGFAARALARLLDQPRRRCEYGPGQREIVRSDFQNNKITSSYPRWSLWEEDIIPNTEAIQFGGVTNHWLRESLTAGFRAVRQAGRIAVPLLLLQAGADRVVRLGVQNRFCRRAQRCTKVRIREAGHEIHIERDELRNEALNRIKGFLSVQLLET